MNIQKQYVYYNSIVGIETGDFSFPFSNLKK